MALVTLPQPIPLLRFPDAQALVAHALTSFIINAAAHKGAWVFQCPKAGVLDKFGIALGTVSQAPSNGLQFSFQDVSTATGAPDGTADQFRVVTAGITNDAWLEPGLITHDGTDGGTKRTVTQHALIACVVEFASFNTGDSVRFSGYQSSLGGWAAGSAYSLLFTASWARQLGQLVTAALKYDDGTYAVPVGGYPARLINALTISTVSTPDEVGIRFQVPFNCEVSGAAYRLANLGAGRDWVLTLYDAADTVLRTVTVDADISLTTSPSDYATPFAPIALEKDTLYRLTYRPNTANANTIYELEANSAGILGALSGSASIQKTHRTDAGAWTDTASRLVLIAPLISAVEDGQGAGPSGGGGGFRSPIGLAGYR